MFYGKIRIMKSILILALSIFIFSNCSSDKKKTSKKNWDEMSLEKNQEFNTRSKDFVEPPILNLHIYDGAFLREQELYDLRKCYYYREYSSDEVVTIPIEKRCPSKLKSRF